MNTTVSKELPQFVRDMMSSPPKSGEGFHNWLFRMARVLHPYRSENDIYGILEVAASSCGRAVSPKEIQDAIRDSQNCVWKPGQQTKLITYQKNWPEKNQEQIEAVLQEGIGLVDLWELSPYRLDENAVKTEEFIDLLFPGNPLLCCGNNPQQFRTKLREEWRGQLNNQSLLVPSPMCKLQGYKKNGSGFSEHTLDNTGDRCYLVIEFDQGSTDEHACFLYHLAKHAPLVMAVFSGSKSLHGWFLAVGQPEERLFHFMRYAVQLGADKATWNRSQFVRMPDAMRENGKKQAVYFLNHKILEVRS